MRRWLLRAIAERTRALLAPSAPKSARMEEDEGTAVFHAMHGIGAYIRFRFGGALPTLPDPVPDVPEAPASPSDAAGAATGVRSSRVLSRRRRPWIRGLVHPMETS
jgi:hypothetical protein